MEHRRPLKRAAISDQQKRRDQTLQRQAQSRRDAQQAARCLASTVLSLQSQTPRDIELGAPPLPLPLPEDEEEEEEEEEEVVLVEEEEAGVSPKELDVVQASRRLKGAEARKWFAKQLMLPEWMIDVPDRLSHDWYVFARPAGKRCFVVSSNGTTISRLRNGFVLHRFPSALPNGARTRDGSGPAQSYSILDCIFHEMDQTYYVIDMVCWRGYSLYDCAFEFRLFWLNSKLGESGACEPPSLYHRYRFSTVPVYNCNPDGLCAAYSGAVPYAKDGLLFYNKHAHYQMGNTPLALVWKDEHCSQYVIDTDSKGQVPSQQQVVLELQTDGKVVTSDDPPVVFGCLSFDVIQKLGLLPGNLIRFAVSDGGLSFVDGKLEKADLQYIGKANRARAFADSYSKVMFQHTVRHLALKLDDLLFICSADGQGNKPCEIEMTG